MKKLLAILMALAMVLSLSVGAFATGEASGETSAVAEERDPYAAIVMGDEGEDPSQERAVGWGYDISYYPGGSKLENSIFGFLFTTDSSDVAFFYSEPTENEVNYTIGGDAANIAPDEYPVSETSAEFLKSVGVESFDSAIILGDDQNADSCDPVISAKGYTNLDVTGILVLAAGAARSAFYSDVSGGTTVAGPGAVGGAQGSETPVVVVSNSLLETTGGDIGGEIAVGNSGGRARGVQPQGKSVTYLYNSAIVSHTWGAWSTDSARQGLDFIAWRSLGLSQGGYGAYADTSCRVFLYGSTLIGSSDGIVASNNGEIYATASDDTASTTELRALMGRTSNTRDLSWEDYPASGEPMESVISGGQTAVQFHMPDMGHSGARNQTQGTLYMNGGKLLTDESLLADDIAAYNARYAGACIVTKSANAYIVLKGTEMESWSGELIHTMINSDSNVNDIADGDETIGSTVIIQDMDVSGDIVHDDYQRELYLTLDNTTLTGAIFCSTWEDWNALCSAEFDGSYILNADGYETWWGVTVDLTNGAVWNVTETSVVTDLIINDGCTVNGVITENADGTLTVSPLEGVGSGEASEDMPLMADGSLPPDPPADLEPGQEPPGGFGGID